MCILSGRLVHDVGVPRSPSFRCLSCLSPPIPHDGPFNQGKSGREAVYALGQTGRRWKFRVGPVVWKSINFVISRRDDQSFIVAHKVVDPSVRFVGRHDDPMAKAAQPDCTQTAADQVFFPRHVKDVPLRVRCGPQRAGHQEAPLDHLRRGQSNRRHFVMGTQYLR